MIRVWRICRRRWARDAYGGDGARRTGGRWNHKGTSIAYASSSLALAALELFVNLQPEDVPADLVAVPLDVPDDVAAREIAVADLPANWREYPAPAAIQDIGSAWIESGDTPLLIVPSVVVPSEKNMLLNSAHPAFARFVVGKPEPFSFDPRMWK